MDETKAMQEIHEIRAKHYELTKNMSDEEFINDVKKEAEKARRLLEELKKTKVS